MDQREARIYSPGPGVYEVRRGGELLSTWSTADAALAEMDKENNAVLPQDPWVPFEQAPSRPGELAPGTVLGFTKRYTEDGPAYSFVAIHVDRLGWYLTGPKYAGHPIVWDNLLDFIGGPDEWARVGVCIGWTPLGGA